MTIEIPKTIEERLRDLASRQGRDIRAVVEDALGQYIDASAITDVDEDEVAEAQSELLKELPRTPPGAATSEARGDLVG